MVRCPGYGELRESDKRPVGWRYVTLMEPTPGRFDVVLPVSRMPITRLDLLAAKLPEQSTRGLPLSDAVALGELIEKFRFSQENRGKK